MERKVSIVLLTGKRTMHRASEMLCLSWSSALFGCFVRTLSVSNVSLKKTDLSVHTCMRLDASCIPDT